MENFAKTFSHIETTHNDEISYVKHVLAPLCVFFRLLVVSLLEAKLH